MWHGDIYLAFFPEVCVIWFPCLRLISKSARPIGSRNGMGTQSIVIKNQEDFIGRYAIVWELFEVYLNVVGWERANGYNANEGKERCKKGTLLIKDCDVEVRTTDVTVDKSVCDVPRRKVRTKGLVVSYFVRCADTLIIVNKLYMLTEYDGTADESTCDVHRQKVSPKMTSYLISCEVHRCRDVQDKMSFMNRFLSEYRCRGRP